MKKHLCYSCKLLVENEKKQFVLYCPVHDNLQFQFCEILMINYVVVAIPLKKLLIHVIVMILHNVYVST